MARRAAAAALVAAAVVLAAAAAPLRAQPRPAQPRAGERPVRADTGALRRALDSLVAPFEGGRRGVVGYAVRNLDTGERLDRRADETFPTASLIKVAVLVTVFDLVEKRQLALDDPLTVLKIDQVPGSGQLQWMHPGLSVTVRDAAWLMSTTSDNTATNLLLDRIVIRRVWQKMEALGLPHTKVHSKVYLRIASVAPDSSVKYGLGVTTPGEMATLFGLLAAGRAVAPAADSAMLDILEHNEDQQLLQRYVDGVRAAHKTGAVDAARTECTLWYLQSRVVACVFTKENQDQRWTIDTEPQLLMGRIGQRIAAAWPPPPSASRHRRDSSHVAHIPHPLARPNVWGRDRRARRRGVRGAGRRADRRRPREAAPGPLAARFGHRHRHDDPHRPERGQGPGAGAPAPRHPGVGGLGGRRARAVAAGRDPGAGLGVDLQRARRARQPARAGRADADAAATADAPYAAHDRCRPERSEGPTLRGDGA